MSNGDWSGLPIEPTFKAMERFLGALGEHADVITRRLIEDHGFAKRLAYDARNDGFQPSLEQKRAVEIMGADNVFGIGDSIYYLNACPTRDQLHDLAHVPFPASMLEECAKTHVLTAVLPQSIVGLRDNTRYGMFHRQEWRHIPACTTAPERAYWCLVRKTPVDNSEKKTLKKQVKRLGPDEMLPSARELVYAMVGHNLLTEKRLFQDMLVRCAYLGGGGEGDACAAVGFGPNGIDVRILQDTGRKPGLYLASAKKPLLPYVSA